MKNDKRKIDGITLIVLVITIIVLLILAGVTIMALSGENGLLSNAVFSKKLTTKMEAKELVQMEILGSYTNDGIYDKDSAKSNIEINLNAKVKDNGDETLTVEYKNNTIIIDKKGEILGTLDSSDFVTGENKEYENNGKAIIPKGFAVSEIPEEQDVSKGLVIKDDEGNEFVWIPVDDYSQFKRNENLNGKFGEADQTGKNTDINVKESNITELEAKEMYESVKINGGFYIGRYETSIDNAGKAKVKPRVLPCVYIPWGDSMEVEGTMGAVDKSRKMYGKKKIDGKYGVSSSLCYGVQWDAALRFIETNPSNNGYSNDSTGRGNYYEIDNLYDWKGKLTKTGYLKQYMVNNIYDLGGNASEWTMESFESRCRVYRGGSYGVSGKEYPSSYRNKQEPMNSFPSVTFRVALYL